MERYDLSVTCGETFRQVLRFENLELGGVTGYCQLREAPGAEKISAEAEVSIDAVDGIVTLGIPAEVTAALTPGVYAYDFCLQEADGTVTYYLGGAFSLTPAVTVIGGGA